jgi:hypothetical protein
MWPFDEIDRLKRRIEYLESLQISTTDKKELEFLRTEIKDYVEYRLERDVFWGTNTYYADRTLKSVESDLTKARFYISVLEAQLGPDGIEAAKNVCQRLQELCTSKKAIEVKSHE